MYTAYSALLPPSPMVFFHVTYFRMGFKTQKCILIQFCFIFSHSMKSGKRLISSAVVFCYFQSLNLCFGCVCFPTFAKRIWSNLTFILFHNKGRGINWKSEFGHNIRQISAHPELFCSKGQSAWNISRYSNPITDKFLLFSCTSWLWLVEAEKECLANDL